MRAMAERAGEDADAWGLVGLLHDFDYERFPNAAHAPDRGAPGRGRADPQRRTGSPSHAGAPSWATPPTPACRATRRWPGRSSPWTSCAASSWPARSCGPRGASQDLEVSSVKKKLKDKAFARGVSREDVVQGAEELGVPLDEHIAFVLGALRPARAHPRPRRRMTGGAPAPSRSAPSRPSPARSTAPPAAGRSPATRDAPDRRAQRLRARCSTSIASAGRWIHFENYIIRDDDAGRRFAEALAAARARGRRVRVLYDWLGSLEHPRARTGASCARRAWRCAPSIRSRRCTWCRISRATTASWWWPTAPAP